MAERFKRIPLPGTNPQRTIHVRGPVKIEQRASNGLHTPAGERVWVVHLRVEGPAVNHQHYETDPYVYVEVASDFRLDGAKEKAQEWIG